MNTEDDSEAKTEEPYYDTVKSEGSEAKTEEPYYETVKSEDPYYSTAEIKRPDASTIELRKNTAYEIPPQLLPRISVERNPAYASVSGL